MSVQPRSKSAAPARSASGKPAKAGRAKAAKSAAPSSRAKAGKFGAAKSGKFSDAPSRVKSGKPARRGTAAKEMSRARSEFDSSSESAPQLGKSTWVKGTPKAGKLTGKTSVRAGSKPSSKSIFKSGKGSSNTPAKREKNSARSQERAKRFADTRGVGDVQLRSRDSRDENQSLSHGSPRDSHGDSQSDSRAPRTTKFAPARRVDTRVDTRSDSRGGSRGDSRGASRSADARSNDTRPTTRRDARIAEVARGDGRPNFEPQKRTKFIPGGKRTGAPARGSDSSDRTGARSSFNRDGARGAATRDDSRTTSNREGSSAGSSSRENFRTSANREGSRPTTRSTHSGIATPHKGSTFRPSSSRNTDHMGSNNSGPRSHNSRGKSGNNYSNNEFVEDFGADDNYINDVEQETTEVALHHKPTEGTGKTWAELGIAPALVSALTSQGITSPFPIQVATLPDAIKGHDILGRGQTGSGKTLAFGLALLTNLEGKQAAPHRPLGLILTPTRELALQINDVITPLARAIRLDSVVIAGGMPYGKQITAMRKSCPILVATPGRLIDLLDKGEVQLDDLQITVLDEADQMADMGFLPVVKEILDQARPNGQRLLFSATLDRGVDSLVKKYLNNPKTHSLQNDRASVSTMEHHVLVMHPGDKDEITAQIASRDGRTILFVKTQRGADRLADKLASVGVPVGALHGGKSQAVRTRTLAHFKASTTAALVATDVAARGIHVDGISLVVHVDAPTDHKDYLHRAGRTARAGEAGVVVTLATSKQQSAVRGLTSRAGVYPKFVDVRPHHAELVSITGSREPSGIAYVVPVMASDGPRRSGKPRPRSDQRRRRPR